MENMVNYGGRPSKVDEIEIRLLKERGLTTKEIADTVGCSISTVTRALQKTTTLNVNDNATFDNYDDTMNENDNKENDYFGNSYIYDEFSRRVPFKTLGEKMEYIENEKNNNENDDEERFTFLVLSFTYYY